MSDIPDYIERLSTTIKKLLKSDQEPVSLVAEIIEFSWSAVFARIRQYW
jgi:hypothetical protein